MADKKPRIDLIPWDFNSEEHQQRMYLQRLACGWRSDEIQKWVELGRAGQKTLYWIVSGILPSEKVQTPVLLLTTDQQALAEDLSDREALNAQHIAKNPQVCKGAFLPRRSYTRKSGKHLTCSV